MSLTGIPLVCLLITLSLLLPVAVAWTWGRGPKGPGGGLVRFLVVLLCQAMAVATIGVIANNSYGFYNSWAELLGRSQQIP